MTNCITWVGMDDSAKTINLAIFRGQESNPREELVITNDSTGLGRMAKKLKALSGEVRCVYEAGCQRVLFAAFFGQASDFM